jgi:serine/threonine-protein kinase RsbW
VCRVTSALVTQMSLDSHIEITIPSRIEYLNLVHAVTDEMSRLAGFDGDASLNISLAVREAATNAVIHGNGKDEAKRVQVRFGIEDGTLRIWIRDQGAGFDPDAVQDPRAASNLVRTSGRGIFLMRSFMDAVTFRRQPGAGMEVCLAKKP